MLFNGAVPPNGFMVQINGASELGNICWVNDNGPASGNPSGFRIGGFSSIDTPISSRLQDIRRWDLSAYRALLLQ